MWELERRVQSQEVAIQTRLEPLGWIRLLRTMPGVGLILGATIPCGLRLAMYEAIRGAEQLAAMPGWCRKRTLREEELAGGDAAGLQSLFEMGLRGSGQCNCGATAAHGKPASARGAAGTGW